MQGKLMMADDNFPQILRDFVPDVGVLYFEGDLTLLQNRCIAIVGSRKCTQYGKTVAKTIGKRAAENGVTVVSGLARGIDTAGHLGALEAGGKTIAVLGGGTEHYYPPENRKLQQQIAREGLLLSEHEPEYIAKAYDFPKRNRLISALSESVVVVEAPNRSGALITAECAEEQGKNVYAVPGNITSYYSFGTNKLIRENATPLILIDDIFLDLNISPYIKEDNLLELGEDERRVFEVVKNCGEVTIDEIYHKTNIKPSEINGIITILEMKGIIFYKVLKNTGLYKIYLLKGTKKVLFA